MPPQKARQAQKAELLADVARLIRARRTTREVAEALGISQSRVVRLNQEANRIYRESSIVDVGERRARQRETIHDLFREARDAWEQSKSPARKSTKRTKGKAKARGGGEGDPPPAEIEATITEENQCGDPRYLDVMLRLLEREAKLDGLDFQKDDPPPPPPATNVNVQINVGDAVQQLVQGYRGELDILRQEAIETCPPPDESSLVRSPEQQA